MPNEILEKFQCRIQVLKLAISLLYFTTLPYKFIEACVTNIVKQLTTIFFVLLMFSYLIATTKKVKLSRFTNWIVL